MSHQTDIFSYRISAPENVGTNYTRYVDSIEAIDIQYSDDVNSRLWRDIKAHKYVQSLKEFEEFYGFLGQKVLVPQCPIIITQDMLVRLFDTK